MFIFKSIKSCLTFLVLIALLVGGWYFYQNYLPRLREQAANLREIPSNINVRDILEKAIQDKSVVVAKTIEITKNGFEPKNVNISPGQTISWTNKDEVAHTITSANFKSGVLNTGKSFSYTFNEKGIYDYYCSIHPELTGKVIVK